MSKIFTEDIFKCIYLYEILFWFYFDSNSTQVNSLGANRQ